MLDSLYIANHTVVSLNSCRALETRPEHVHLAPMPNLFRGLYTRDRLSSEADRNAGFQVDPTPEEEELLAAKYAGVLEYCCFCIIYIGFNIIRM